MNSQNICGMEPASHFVEIFFLKKYLNKKIIKGNKCSKLLKNSFKDVLKNSQPFFAHPSLT